MFAFGVRFSRVSISGALLILGTAPPLANAACNADCVNVPQDNLLLNNGSWLNIGTGGTVTNSTVSHGQLHLWESASARRTTINGNGWMEIHDNGHVEDTVMENGMILLSGSATALHSTISGGDLEVIDNAVVSDTLLNGGRMYVYYDATAKNTTVNNSQMNVYQNGNADRTTVNEGGQLSVSDTASVSDTVVNQGGVMDIAGGTGVRSTTVNQGGLMVLAARASARDTTINRDADLLLKGFATLGGSTHVDGRVTFADPAFGGFHTLTVDGPLSGHGTFIMNTDLAALQGDLIQVNGLISDSHTLVVADSGNAPTAPSQPLMLVNGRGGVGNGLFKLYGETVDAGAYRYQLQRQGNDWYLASLASVPQDPTTEVPEQPPTDAKPPRVPPVEPASPATPIEPDRPVVPVETVLPPQLPQAQTLSKGANAAVASPAANAALLSTQMNATLGHFGDLRSGQDRGGLWTRGYSAEQRLDTGVSRAFQQQVNGMEIGADKALPFANGTLYVGGSLGKGQARQQFGERSKGTIDSATLGGYASYLDQSGWYVDGLLKYNRLDNRVDITSNVGDSVKAHDKNHAVSSDVQLGKSIDLGKGWFVEPQAGLQVSRISSGRYTASNGLSVEQDAMTSVQSRVGGMLGRNVQFDHGIKVKPYAKATWITEHAGDSHVTVNGSRLDSRLPGSRAEIGGGVMVSMADKHNVFVDGQYTKGQGIEQPWAVTVGYRYNW